MAAEGKFVIPPIHEGLTVAEAKEVLAEKKALIVNNVQRSSSALAFAALAAIAFVGFLVLLRGSEPLYPFVCAVGALVFGAFTYFGTKVDTRGTPIYHFLYGYENGPRLPMQTKFLISGAPYSFVAEKGTLSFVCSGMKTKEAEGIPFDVNAAAEIGFQVTDPNTAHTGQGRILGHIRKLAPFVLHVMEKVVSSGGITDLMKKNLTANEEWNAEAERQLVQATEAMPVSIVSFRLKKLEGPKALQAEQEAHLKKREDLEALFEVGITTENAPSVGHAIRESGLPKAEVVEYEIRFTEALSTCLKANLSEALLADNLTQKGLEAVMPQISKESLTESDAKEVGKIADDVWRKFERAKEQAELQALESARLKVQQALRNLSFRSITPVSRIIEESGLPDDEIVGLMEVLENRASEVIHDYILERASARNITITALGELLVEIETSEHLQRDTAASLSSVLNQQKKELKKAQADAQRLEEAEQKAAIEALAQKNTRQLKIAQEAVKVAIEKSGGDETMAMAMMIIQAMAQKKEDAE